MQPAMLHPTQENLPHLTPETATNATQAAENNAVRKARAVARTAKRRMQAIAVSTVQQTESPTTDTQHTAETTTETTAESAQSAPVTKPASVLDVPAQDIPNVPLPSMLTHKSEETEKPVISQQTSFLRRCAASFWQRLQSVRPAANPDTITHSAIDSVSTPEPEAADNHAESITPTATSSVSAGRLQAALHAIRHMAQSLHTQVRQRFAERLEQRWLFALLAVAVLAIQAVFMYVLDHSPHMEPTPMVPPTTATQQPETLPASTNTEVVDDAVILQLLRRH